MLDRGGVAEVLTKREPHPADELRDLLAGGAPLVVLGAGNLGSKIAEFVRGSDIELAAVADNGSDRWGEALHGTTVRSPADVPRDLEGEGGVGGRDLVAGSCLCPNPRSAARVRRAPSVSRGGAHGALSRSAAAALSLPDARLLSAARPPDHGGVSRAWPTTRAGGSSWRTPMPGSTCASTRWRTPMWSASTSRRTSSR